MFKVLVDRKLASKEYELASGGIQCSYQLSAWTSVRTGFVSCKVCLLVMFCSIQHFQWKLVRHQNILFAGSWDPVRATNRLLVSPTQYEDPIWENGGMQLRPQSQEGIAVIKEMLKLPHPASHCFLLCVYETWRRGVRRRLTTCRRDQSDAQGTHGRKLDDSCRKIVNASSVKNTCKRGLYIVERSGSVWGVPRSEDGGAEGIRKSALCFQ